MNFNWNNIRSVKYSQEDGFEEFVCQLARKEEIENKKEFVRKGNPDAGIECFWILNNGDEYGWQAKFFTNSLTESQWNQITKSVKAALTSHPKLKRYYIAIPIDPSDGRIEGRTSMLDKWNSWVSKWEKLAEDYELNVEFIPWWSSDLIERLQKPENVGMTYFWFNKEEFTDEWCIQQCEDSIKDLGKRYTPKLNVKLEIAKIFNGISRDENFNRQVTNLFDDVLSNGSKIIPQIQELDNYAVDIEKVLNSIYTLFHNINLKGIQKLPIIAFQKLLSKANEFASHLREYYLYEESKLNVNPDDYRYYKKFGYELSYISDFKESIFDLTQFLEGTTVKLANFPFLLLEGEAGVGKSHLLADIISTRTKNNLISLFFLGQHFVTDEDPWTQIFKKNDIKCSVNQFLGALNSKAQISGQRIIIFIDAVNEGRGKYFWKENIRSFLSKIKTFEWIGAVISIRKSYSELIFPVDEIKDDVIIRHTHYGFINQEYEATKLFFNNYDIELPSTPLLHPEFQNPLFLLLFCEGLHKAGCTRIPKGLQGITAIIDFFIDSVNKILSTPTRLDYPPKIKVVKKSIDALIKYKVENQLGYVPYEDAFLLLNKVSDKYRTGNGLLDELISEGIFSKNLFWDFENNKEEGIYLAYERFEDHLISKHILDKTPELEDAFKKGGTLFYLVENEDSCYVNKGVIEALSIQLPERTGKELYEYVSEIKQSVPIIECFVHSLLWRKTETITEKLDEYVEFTVLKNLYTHQLFMDTILTISSIPDHYFNAYFLHKILLSIRLPDRDAWWTIYLRHQFDDETAVKKIIDWSWDAHDKSHVSDESIRLMAIILSWFHTSTNRKLRDSSTKALICLLENRILVLIELLKEFETVDDPYVYERLYAVAYGCSVRTSQTEHLIDLSNYIYETVFKDKPEVYPHILLRDYARGVIEFTSHLGYSLSFNISESRPPYRSIFPETFPTNVDINEKYKFDYKLKDFNDHHRAQNSILHSMAIEFGRGPGFGDFGQYVFLSAIRTWDVDANALSNLVVEWIFEKYGYNKDKHGLFDRDIGSGRGRDTLPNERIGKKYQWLAFYEILARVSDNCKKYTEWSYIHDELEEYQGPWSPNVRDIDPTMLINKTGRLDQEEPSDFWWSQVEYANWELSNKEWVKLSDDLPCSKQLINVIDKNNEEWLILEGYPEWIESKKVGDKKWDKPRKRIWYQLRSYLIADAEYEKAKRWASEQDFMGRWMPESSNLRGTFNREHYWSPAYNYFKDNDYYDAVEQREIFNSLANEHFKVILTTNDFLWSAEFDQSKEDNISFLMPSSFIYENMKLIFSMEKEGEFTDETGNIICFAPTVDFNTESYLLIKKEPFLKFLKESKLKILWTVLGEKNIIGGRSSEDGFHGRLEISGAYFLNESNSVEGNIITKFT